MISTFNDDPHSLEFLAWVSWQLEIVICCLGTQLEILFFQHHWDCWLQIVLGFWFWPKLLLQVMWAPSVCVCVSVITFVLWGSDCIIAVCKLCWGFCQLCCHCTGAPHFKICLLTMYPGYHNFNLLYILTEVAWEGMDALAQCMGREFPKSYVQNP